MESGLTFDQLICEFESRRPCQTFHVGCSSTARAPRCERGDDEFNSRQPTQSILCGTVAER